ncbi:MAG: hypothetical protein MJ177_06085 [Clostridia bacterium]|nr:hypothetical protein [Clostridia bacterium]
MTSIFRKILSLIIVYFIIGGARLTGSYQNTDIKAVTNNIIDGIISGNPGMFSSSDIKDPEDIIRLTQDDGEGGLYFSDIDYQNGERSSWPAARHITRTGRLAVLFYTEQDEQKKAEYRDYVLKLLDHWIRNDYQNSNWWHNRLSNPNLLGEIGLLMRGELSRKQLLRLSELVSRGSFTVTPVLYDHTGANAMELAMSTIKFGALTGSKKAIRDAVKVARNVLKYTDGEGLNNDGTFFQHGKRIYMGGYGIVFINGISNIIYMLSGTDFNFSEKQLAPLSKFILDGMRKMSFGATLDPSTMGRSVSRKNPQPLPGLAVTLRRLAGVPEMPRKNELLSYAESIENDAKENTGLGYFDTAKFLVINNEDFYFSFRGGNEEIVYSEIINDENVLGYNSSFPGTTTIMHTGKETINISPVYDYSFVPGATAVYENDEELLAHEDFTYRYLKGKFGGQVKDGTGIVFAKTSHEDIDMTVACFATDNSALLVGAGMKDAAGRKMNTCLDQSFYTGNYTQNGNTVIHNGIKYDVLQGGTLTAKAQHRTGSWKRNNLPMSAEAVEGDIFTVYIENTGSYAYTVMSESTDESYEIIVNSEKLQAVRMPGGQIAAVFYENGSFEYAGKNYSGKAGSSYIF